MDKNKDIDLRKAFPEMPDMCRNAVLQAVSAYQEEQDMKRRYRIVLIAAVILTLMCSVAFAITQYYSVREYVAMGNPSTAFEEAIVPCEHKRRKTKDSAEGIEDSHYLLLVKTHINKSVMQVTSVGREGGFAVENSSCKGKRSI